MPPGASTPGRPALARIGAQPIRASLARPARLRWGGALLVGTLAALGLVPIALVLGRGFNFAPAVLARDLDVLGSTLGLVGLGMLLALVVGGGLALIAVEAGLPGWADGLIVAPYLVPPFIGAAAWLAALGAGNPITGTPILDVYGWGGILLAWTTHFAPLAFLLVKASLEGQAAHHAQAARVHGLSAGRTLVAVTLPLARPGIVAAAALLFLTLLGNFGVPAVLGFPAKVYTLATLAYARLLNPTLVDSLGAASGAALVLVAVALPVMLARPRSSGGPVSVLDRPPPGGRGLAWAAVGVWTTVALIVPLASVLVLALKPAYSSGITLEHFQGAFALPTVGAGLRHSLLLALGAGLLAAGLGLAVALAERSSPIARLGGRLLALPYLLPGTILALGFVLAWAPTPAYGTTLVLALAYLSRFLAPGAEASRSGLAARGDALELAARVHGVPPGLAFRRVTLPLLRPYLAAAFLIVYPLALSEITLSAILYAPGAETVGMAVLGLLNEGNLRGAAAVATVLLALSAPALLVPRRTA